MSLGGVVIVIKEATQADELANVLLSDIKQVLFNGGRSASIEALIITDTSAPVNDVPTFADDGPANKQDPGLQSTPLESAIFKSTASNFYREETTHPTTGMREEVVEASASRTQNFREYIRNVNSQTAAPIRLSFNSTHGHREDISQETSTPSSFGSSHDFVTRRRAAFNNDGGNDDREHFVFPDPLSPVTERGTSSDVIGVEPAESSSSENIIIEAQLCGSPQQSRAHKGKGIARNSAVSPNPQERIFLPLLKEDSHFPRQPEEHEKQTQKSRSNSFHSKLANLDMRLATVPEAPKLTIRPRDAERDQKTIRHLRLQNLIQRDQIKNLRIHTKDLAEGPKQLRGSTARDVRSLEEGSDIQRENHNRLVGAWEGMRRELLQLKLRMAQEQLGQRVVSRHEVEEVDGFRRGGSHAPVVSSPPPPNPLQPTPMEYAFGTQAGTHDVDAGGVDGIAVLFAGVVARGGVWFE
ncbi:hypothetical protein Q7P36_000174 [Cladosporium allicinum]